MQPIITTLMAVLLAVHAAVGCCWHHSHAHEEEVVKAQAKTCCDHPQDADEGQQPTECEECEGTCQYLMAEKVRLDDVRMVGWIAIAPTAEYAIVGGARNGEWCYPIDSGPPLRLHLLHQVLII